MKKKQIAALVEVALDADDHRLPPLGPPEVHRENEATVSSVTSAIPGVQIARSV